MILSNFLSKHKNFIFHGFICLVLLLFFLDHFYDFSSELTFLIATLLVLTVAILILRFKQLLLYMLSFLIPLSVPLVIGTSQISMPSELVIVMLGAFFFVKVILDKKPNRQFMTHPITILILLDVTWLFISSVFSEMPEVSFKRLFIRTCYYITFYYFYYEMFRMDVKNIKKIFTLHICGFLIPILYATINHASLGFTTVGSQRISAPFYFDHTIYGACLVFFIPFIFLYATGAQSRKEKTLYGSLLFVFLTASLLSYSRAAWISLFIAATLALILRYRIKIKYLALATLVLCFAAFLNFERIKNSLSQNKDISHSNDVGKHFKSISNINTDASNKERINRWKCALRMFADKPLAGFGPGTYQFFYGQYQQIEDLTRISTYNGTKGHAHSEYLNYLSETGLPGLLIFLTLIAVVCRRALYVFKNTASPAKITALAVFAALVTYFVHAFFNGFLEFDKMAMPVFCSMAVITALDLQIKPLAD
ncbi:MAG: O-antigen ligase family protein [Bacteroidota bacterium]